MCIEISFVKREFIGLIFVKNTRVPLFTSENLFVITLSPGIRPLFILPSLIAVVDQYPEIPSHNIGHFRSTKKIRFRCKYSSLFIFANSRGFNVHADIRFDMTLHNFVAILNRKKVPQNRDIYVEPTNFQEKSVHITLELAFLEIKAVNPYLN